MSTYTLIYDTDLRRPACVLLQAAYGCGSHPHALRHFKAETWLVHPTPGMKKLAATDEQWAQLASLEST